MDWSNYGQAVVYWGSPLLNQANHNASGATRSPLLTATCVVAQLRKPNHLIRGRMADNQIFGILFIFSKRVSTFESLAKMARATMT